jgi:hypothetical protein
LSTAINNCLPAAGSARSACGSTIARHDRHRGDASMVSGAAEKMVAILP